MLHQTFRTTSMFLAHTHAISIPMGPMTPFRQLQHSTLCWEHCVDINCILHRLKHAGATVSTKKLFISQPEVLVIGQTCNYNGCIPDASKVSKVTNWPSPCCSRTEVCRFLGTTGTVSIWVQDYAKISCPLVNLTHDTVPFTWTTDAQAAMDALKAAVAQCPTIQPIDYRSGQSITLAVNSSYITVSYILFQDDTSGCRQPSRFGSITWNNHESHYSQAKLNCTVWIIGVKHLMVEVNAKYIKGMLNNPDVQPNATMNRWITGILTFDFFLKHVSAVHHQGPDGLSRR